MWKKRPFNSDAPDPFGKKPSASGGKHLTADSSKCPACAANIFYQPEVQGLVCRNCGNIYDPETLTKTGAFGYSIEHDYTGDSDVSEDDKKRHEIVCNSCGATLIADENMMSTMCPFCGSPALITRRMTREFKPDYIIPFKIDRETAENNIKHWIKTRELTPGGFKTKSKVTRMMPFYVPFWLLDCAVNTDLFGTGKRVGKDTVSKISVRAKANYYVKGVPFDASRKIANKLMEAIEPFDYSEMVKFENRFLQGFYADKYDQDPFGMLDRFIKRLDRISMGLNDNISAKYDGYDPSPEKNFTWMSEVNIKYCLLPVWFMTVEFDGDIYQFAVNGQTGEASGQAPTSGAVDKMDSFLSFTRSNWKWIPVTVAAILPVVIFLITLSGNTSPFILFLFLTICILETLLIIFSVMIFVLNNIGSSISDRIHRKADASNDFDKAPGLDAYLDTKHLTKLSVDEYIFRLELDEDEQGRRKNPLYEN